MKSYLYLAFFFMVMTYLTPKEQYRRYFRFMLGVFLAVIILKPLAAGYEYDMRFAELTKKIEGISYEYCLLYTSPSPRDKRQSRMPSSA